MGVVLLLPETTKNPITLMGERAGICWEADTTNPEKNYKRGLDCLSSGHGRVMEYVNVELVLRDYSARVIREWYTHLGGAPTRLQASTRRIDYSSFKYVTPPSIVANNEACIRYDSTMREIGRLCEVLEKQHGGPREDVALLLPLGMCTTIVDKRNLRNLVDMSRQRMCGRAYHEYRDLFQSICTALSSYSEEWKYIVDNYFHPKCEELGYCPEQQSCGKTPQHSQK